LVLLLKDGRQVGERILHLLFLSTPAGNSLRLSLTLRAVLSRRFSLILVLFSFSSAVCVGVCVYYVSILFCTSRSVARTTVDWGPERREISVKAVSASVREESLSSRDRRRPKSDSPLACSLPEVSAV
jgi:hypothetical protein